MASVCGFHRQRENVRECFLCPLTLHTAAHGIPVFRRIGGLGQETHDIHHAPIFLPFMDDTANPLDPLERKKCLLFLLLVFIGHDISHPFAWLTTFHILWKVGCGSSLVWTPRVGGADLGVWRIA